MTPPQTFLREFPARAAALRGARAASIEVPAPAPDTVPMPPGPAPGPSPEPAPPPDVIEPSLPEVPQPVHEPIRPIAWRSVRVAMPQHRH